MDLSILKTASGIVVGTGVGKIVGNVVKSVTPEDLSRANKLAYRVGGWALSGFIAGKTIEYVEGQIDSLEKGINVGLNLSKQMRDKKVVVIDKDEDVETDVFSDAEPFDGNEEK
jgi:hypothetical protein